MKTVSLSGSLRENVGSKDAKVLRKEGRVPGVIYGNGENIHFHVKEQSKTYKTEELKILLEQKDFLNVPFEKVADQEKIKVIERWVPKEHSLTFYGTFNRLSVEYIPEDLIKAAEKSRKLGANNDAMARDRKRIMKSEDWGQLIANAKKENRSTIDILTADYSNNEEKEISMSLKDNVRPNFGTIFLYLFIICFVITMGLLFVNAQFPEFVAEFIANFN